jgi:N-terminal acetyltransferase B complex non-catalytic subunit
VRSQKVEESLALCDEVLAVKPLDDATISAMMHVLKGLGRSKSSIPCKFQEPTSPFLVTDMVNMFEEAYKQQPLNEEYGAQTFFAHVRTANWKSAQQVYLSRLAHIDLTSVASVLIGFYKNAQTIPRGPVFVLERDGGNPPGPSCPYSQSQAHIAHSQASNPSTTPSMKSLLYKLAHRLVTSSPSPSYVTADRFHMHISILKELELYDEANTLLESDIGKTICSTSLACDQTRREIWRGRGFLGEEGQRAQQKILNGSV